MGAIKISTLLPMRNKFVYSCRVKNPCFKVWWTLGKHFLPSVGFGSIFPTKRVVKMLEVVVVSWWEVRWIWQMSQNFLAQFLQLLKLCLCDLWSVIVMEKNWALFRWTMLAAGIAIFTESHQFAEYASQM